MTSLIERRNKRNAFSDYPFLSAFCLFQYNLLVLRHHGLSLSFVDGSPNFFEFPEAPRKKGTIPVIFSHRIFLSLRFMQFIYCLRWQCKQSLYLLLSINVHRKPLPNKTIIILTSEITWVIWELYGNCVNTSNSTAIKGFPCFIADIYFLLFGIVWA